MTEPRTYVIGLPVIITVDHKNVVITVSVDLSEAGAGIAEEPNNGYVQMPDGTLQETQLQTEDEQIKDVELVEAIYAKKVPSTIRMEWQ